MWQLNPYALALIIIVVPLLTMIQLSWVRRHHQAARYFLVLAIVILGHVLVHIAELLSATEAGILFWSRLAYFFHISPIFWLMFILVYLGYEQQVTKKLIACMLLPMMLVNVAVWTNDWHQLIWVRPGAQSVQGLAYFVTESRSWLYYLHISYIYGIIIFGAVLIIHRTLLSGGIFRWQMWLLLLGVSMPPLGLMVNILFQHPLNKLDFEVFGIALGTIPYAVALFRYKAFDIQPAAYHQRVLNSIGNGVIVFDDLMRIIEVNPAARALFGLGSVPELTGQFLIDVQPHLCQWFNRVSQHPGPHVTEFELAHEGEAKVAEARLFVTEDRANHARNWIIVIRDITSRRQMEQNQLLLLAQHERMRVLEGFVRDMTHDFRMPLNAIGTSAAQMKMTSEHVGSVLRHDDQQEPYGQQMQTYLARVSTKADAIAQSVSRLAYLVDQMVDMTRLDHKHTYHMAPSALCSIVDAAAAELADACAQKQITLQVACAPDLPLVMVDANEIQRAVICLLENACQYTPTGGHIWIRAHHDQDDLVIELQDTGIGIAPEHHEHIFERLYRADAARRMNTGGSGLGLAIARSIVVAHHGTLTFSSVLHEGTAFVLRLPIHQQVMAADSLVAADEMTL